jgi:hypothetical protein
MKGKENADMRERHFFGGESMSITALEGLQCSPARPSARTIMKVYTLKDEGCITS